MLIRDAWIGEGRARAVPADLRRAMAVYAVACLLLTAIVALAAIVPRYV